MRYRKRIALMLAVFIAVTALPGSASKPEKISFPSTDGLEITADLYAPHPGGSTPFIVLFHQAGWSRGEYVQIAPRLNKMGFNCMAVDQRSGGRVNGVENETAEKAAAAELGTSYIDARPDLVAALQYARKTRAEGQLIAWGSSYSSALVLQIAGEQPELMDALLSFAPGEYFGKLGKGDTWITESAKNIQAPVFITSARQEKGQWQKIYEAIPSKSKASYLPPTAGNHGSRALWKQFDDSAGYWEAVTAFLEQFSRSAEH